MAPGPGAGPRGLVRTSPGPGWARSPRAQPRPRRRRAAATGC